MELADFAQVRYLGYQSFEDVLACWLEGASQVGLAELGAQRSADEQVQSSHMVHLAQLGPVWLLFVGRSGV